MVQKMRPYTVQLAVGEPRRGPTRAACARPRSRQWAPRHTAHTQHCRSSTSAAPDCSDLSLGNQQRKIVSRSRPDHPQRGVKRPQNNCLAGPAVPGGRLCVLPISYHLAGISIGMVPKMRPYIVQLAVSTTDDVNVFRVATLLRWEDKECPLSCTTM